jgi:hypothetical protein
MRLCPGLLRKHRTNTSKLGLATTIDHNVPNARAQLTLSTVTAISATVSASSSKRPSQTQCLAKDGRLPNTIKKSRQLFNGNDTPGLPKRPLLRISSNSSKVMPRTAISPQFCAKSQFIIERKAHLLSRSSCISASEIGSLGGQPSIIHPTPPPCDSPKVVTRNTVPYVLPAPARTSAPINYKKIQQSRSPHFQTSRANCPLHNYLIKQSKPPIPSPTTTREESNESGRTEPRSLRMHQRRHPDGREPHRIRLAPTQSALGLQHRCPLALP